MVKSTETNGSDPATEELANQPPKLPTHPDELENLPPPNVVPDGVSPPIQHPLDPLNAGKIKPSFFKRKKNQMINFLFAFR